MVSQAGVDDEDVTVVHADIPGALALQIDVGGQTFRIGRIPAARQAGDDQP